MKPEFQYGVEIFCFSGGKEGCDEYLTAEVKTERYAIVLDKDNSGQAVFFNVFFYNGSDATWYRPCGGPYHSSRLEELVPLLTRFYRILRQDSHRFAPSPIGEGFVWK